MMTENRADLDKIDLGDDLTPGTRRKMRGGGFGQLDIPGGADQDVERKAETLGRAHGANRQVAAEIPPVPLVSVHIQLPEYLSDKLAEDAARQKTSKQAIMLAGLRAIGYLIRDEDMVGDRRRRSRK